MPGRWLKSNGNRPRQVDRKTPLWFELANFGGIGDGMNMAFRRSAFEVGQALTNGWVAALYRWRGRT